VIVRSFDPFREFDRMTESMFGPQGETNMPYDAVRRGDDVIVDIDLPGIDPESIDITVERNHVSLRAERHRPTRDGDVVLASGRRHGQFRRDLYLGEALDSSRISAQYDNGVLTLTVPLAESAQPRKVAIDKGAQQPVDVQSRES
jgi:HSP20 family protein